MCQAERKTKDEVICYNNVLIGDVTNNLSKVNILASRIFNKSTINSICLTKCEALIYDNDRSSK